MNEPLLLSINNHVLVGKNPHGKRADEGGNAWIRGIEENGVKVQFTLDGRKRLVSPQRILSKANIDTLARQHACDDLPRASLLSVYHSSKRHTNTKTEKRSTQQTIRPVYKKLLASQNWVSNQKKIENHPMLTYLQEGREKEFGWLQKEEADASKKTITSGKERVHLDASKKELLVNLYLHSTILYHEGLIFEVFTYKRFSTCIWSQC